MADVQTPFAVKTKDSGDVVAKLVDSAGSNLLAISATGQLSVKTATDGDVVAKISDGTDILAISATGQISVKTDADGDVVVKVSDGTDTLLIDGDGKVGVNTDADRVAGAAIGTDGLIMMGSDGTDARFLKVDAAGILQVSTEGATGTIIDSGVLTHGGDLAPGASGSSDTAFITTSTTGKVLRFVVSSSVPFKAILKTNANAGTLVDQRVVFGNAGETVELNIVDGAISLVSDGDDRFRVTVTNMDDVETATIYSSITWTEE